MDRDSPGKPENLPADLVSEIQEISGLDEATVREIAAFEIAARRIGFWERLLEPESSSLSEKVRRFITPPDTTPLPAWTDKIVRDLNVDAADHARAEALLRRLMALVGRDENAVRAFLQKEDPNLHVPVVEAVRAYGLGALDQVLRDIADGGSS